MTWREEKEVATRSAEAVEVVELSPRRAIMTVEMTRVETVLHLRK